MVRTVRELAVLSASLPPTSREQPGCLRGRAALNSHMRAMTQR